MDTEAAQGSAEHVRGKLGSDSNEERDTGDVETCKVQEHAGRKGVLPFVSNEGESRREGMKGGSIIF